MDESVEVIKGLGEWIICEGTGWIRHASKLTAMPKNIMRAYFSTCMLPG